MKKLIRIEDSKTTVNSDSCEMELHIKIAFILENIQDELSSDPNFYENFGKLIVSQINRYVE